jgi:hypothetical protein
MTGRGMIGLASTGDFDYDRELFIDELICQF